MHQEMALLIIVLLLSTLQEEEGVGAECANEPSMQCLAILHPRHSFSQVVKNYALESETSWSTFTGRLSSCASCASSGRRVFVLSQSTRAELAAVSDIDTITITNSCPGCVAWEEQRQQKRKRQRTLPSPSPPRPSAGFVDFSSLV